MSANHNYLNIYKEESPVITADASVQNIGNTDFPKGLHIRNSKTVAAVSLTTLQCVIVIRVTLVIVKKGCESKVTECLQVVISEILVPYDF